MDPDVDAIRRAQAGDPGAFRVLVDRHAPALFAWLGWVVADADAREDVAQEAFVAAWRALPRFEEAKGSFRGWLFTIARNVARNAVRKRRPLVVDAVPPIASTDVHGEPEVMRLLDAALAGLPAEQRAAVLLAEIHALPLSEVARMEGVPVGTVKSRLARGRARLRAVLGQLREEVRR